MKKHDEIQQGLEKYHQTHQHMHHGNPMNREKDTEVTSRENRTQNSKIRWENSNLYI